MQCRMVVDVTAEGQTGTEVVYQLLPFFALCLVCAGGDICQ